MDSAQGGAGCGARSHHPETTSPAETKSWTPNHLRHSGAPFHFVVVVDDLTTAFPIFIRIIPSFSPITFLILISLPLSIFLRYS